MELWFQDCKKKICTYNCRIFLWEFQELLDKKKNHLQVHVSIFFLFSVWLVLSLDIVGKEHQATETNAFSLWSGTVPGESFKDRWKLFILPSKHICISCIDCKICRSFMSTLVNFQHQIWTFILRWIMRTDKHFLTSLQCRTKITIITQNEDKEKEPCLFMWLFKLLRSKKSLRECYFF